MFETRLYTNNEKSLSLIRSKASKEGMHLTSCLLPDPKKSILTAITIPPSLALQYQQYQRIMKKTRKVPHSLLGEWGTPNYSGAALSNSSANTTTTL